MTNEERHHTHIASMRSGANPHIRARNTDRPPPDGLKRRLESEGVVNSRNDLPSSPGRHIQRADWQDCLTYYRKMLVLQQIRVAGILVRTSNEPYTIMLPKQTASPTTIKIRNGGDSTTLVYVSNHESAHPPITKDNDAAQCTIDDAQGSNRTCCNSDVHSAQETCHRRVEENSVSQGKSLSPERLPKSRDTQDNLLPPSAQNLDADCERRTCLPFRRAPSLDGTIGKPSWFGKGSSFRTWSLSRASGGFDSASSFSVTGGRGTCSDMGANAKEGSRRSCFGRTLSEKSTLPLHSRIGGSGRETWYAKCHEQGETGGRIMEMVFFEDLTARSKP